jgi:excisionase family DNA binding protein
MRDSEKEPAHTRLPSLPNRLLTIQEAADYLSVPVRWVQDAVQQRRIRCTRIGKHVRFTPEHLAEMIHAGEQPVTTPSHTGVPRSHTGRRSRL